LDRRYYQNNNFSNLGGTYLIQQTRVLSTRKGWRVEVLEEVNYTDIKIILRNKKLERL